MLANAINGAPKETLLVVLRSFQSRDLHHDLLLVASGEFQHKSRDEIQSHGYVVYTLKADLWAFAHTDSFADGALLAVNLGHDADRAGAVYGQIAGSCYGHDAIPAEWINAVYDAETIAATGQQLHLLSGKITPSQEAQILAKKLENEKKRNRRTQA